MNKKTVNEAIEQGLKYLEKVMIEVEFSNKNNDNSAFFYSKLNGGITISGDTEIYLPTNTETAPEPEPKLEMGQYWHHPEDGDEWLVGKKKQGAYFVCECTKEGDIWVVSQIEAWDLGEFNDCGYVLGRHPDNVEPQPEQWQPKEGELVWSKHLKSKVKFLYIGNTLGNTKFPIVEDCDSDKHISPFSELEPYANQDAKIDSSIAGQWLRCGDNIIKVTLDEDSHCFWGEYLGGVASHKFSKDVNWQLLTAAQMKPLLDAIAALTESQSD